MQEEHVTANPGSRTIKKKNLPQAAISRSTHPEKPFLRLLRCTEVCPKHLGKHNWVSVSGVRCGNMLFFKKANLIFSSANKLQTSLFHVSSESNSRIL